LVNAAEPQLTDNGFSFSLANGDYANPFYSGSSYYEYLSVPPYVNGAGIETPGVVLGRGCAGAKLSGADACGTCRSRQLRPRLSLRANLTRKPLSRLAPPAVGYFA
jgi:hypothetical protein